MKEGSLDAPTRHPLAWRDDEFYDADALDKETRRVFDICHGCRRCFNLCESFPRLFDLIDDSESGELDTVASSDFQPVIDACTLCDMCFMTKCPYVPPHEFDLDFPHLMLRHRAKDFADGKISAADKTLAKTDRNGRLGVKMSGVANRIIALGNRSARQLLEKTMGIDQRAHIPEFADKSFMSRAEKKPVELDREAPGFGLKVVFYATCFTNYQEPALGLKARAILEKNGVQVATAYPGCCGMPLLENGDLAGVAKSARHVAAELRDWIGSGHEVVALTPSCALMLKFEWPLIEPQSPDIRLLSENTWDLSEYIVHLAKKHGLVEGLQGLDGGVNLHLACHARAQNIGAKGAELLRLIPDMEMNIIDRCSGHGGKWGIFTDNFQAAVKVGTPAARKALRTPQKYLVSECPLAREHLQQISEQLEAVQAAAESVHPVDLLARAYGITIEDETK